MLSCLAFPSDKVTAGLADNEQSPQSKVEAAIFQGAGDGSTPAEGGDILRRETLEGLRLQCPQRQYGPHTRPHPRYQDSTLHQFLSHPLRLGLEFLL